MCHYFRVSNKFVLKREISRFSVEKLLSHNAEIFCRGIFLFFRMLECWGIEKLNGSEENITKFYGKFAVSQY